MLFLAAALATQMYASDTKGTVQGPHPEREGVFILCAHAGSHAICRVSDVATGTTAVALCTVETKDNYTNWGRCSGGIKQEGSDERPTTVPITCPIEGDLRCRFGFPDGDLT
jgi:hypothetical protein